MEKKLGKFIRKSNKKQPPLGLFSKLLDILNFNRTKLTQQ